MLVLLFLLLLLLFFLLRIWFIVAQRRQVEILNFRLAVSVYFWYPSIQTTILIRRSDSCVM
jgi:hypothetical protein